MIASMLGDAAGGGAEASGLSWPVDAVVYQGGAEETVAAEYDAVLVLGAGAR